MTPKQVIRNVLANLATDLKQFEQTKQGVMGKASIAFVADCLRCAYDDPRPYTIGVLGQVIEAFLEETKNDT